MHRYAICCVALFNSCMPKYQLLLSHWLQRVCQAAAWQLVFNFCRYCGKIGPQKGGKRGCTASNHRDMPSIALPFKWWKPEFISTFQFVSAPPLACPSSRGCTRWPESPYKQRADLCPMQDRVLGMISPYTPRRTPQERVVPRLLSPCLRASRASAMRNFLTNTQFSLWPLPVHG